MEESKKEKKSKKSKNKLVIILGCILGAVLLILGVGYGVARSYLGKINYVSLETLPEEIELSEEEIDKLYQDEYGEEDDDLAENPELEEEQNSIIAENINLNRDIMDSKDVLNVLLIGTDNRKEGSRGLSDTMIIVSINSKTKQIVATSLLRDIYLYIPGKSNHNRLNYAYIAGGAKLLIQTIEENFKIDIDKYAMVDFYSFIDIVDQVGGVTIELTKEELKHFNNYVSHLNTLLKVDDKKDQLSEPGSYLLNGKQALAFARIRYVGTDFARTARQRLVLELIFNKVKQMTVKDMADFMEVVLPMVTTDFTENELLGQMLKMPSYLNYDLVSWSIPMKGTYKNIKARKMSVLGIDFQKNIEEMYQRIYLGNAS